MPLTPGTKLGVFEITGHLGKGGMGEVYEARDSKLGRNVAIKVLPDAFAANTESLARFKREAQSLAALNHTNVATIHGFEHDADRGIHFLVMELIDGETLGERISAKGMPVEEAVRLFTDIAHGLDAAHEIGIVHRDLKPDNIKINTDGVVKILDFGLAKNTLASKPVRPDDPTTPMSPVAITAEGTFMGTPMYMSPEQARGQDTDKRTDIWAFGCCLYEALTGDIPFKGETIADTVGAILEREPDWEKLPPNTPFRLHVLIQHCLEKKPRDRMRDIGDAVHQLEELAELEEETLVVQYNTGKLFVGFSAAILLSLAVGFFISKTTQPVLDSNGSLNFDPNASLSVPGAPPKRFDIDAGMLLPIGFIPAYAELDISPDGTHLAYAANKDGEKRIYLQDLASGTSMVISDSDEARNPFFSKDNQWIAYFGWTGDEIGLIRRSLSVDKQEIVCSLVQPNGGTWLDDGTIVFGATMEEAQFDANGILTPRKFLLYRVESGTKKADVLIKPDEAEGEINHFNPSAIPNTNTLLYVASNTGDRFDVNLLDLDNLQSNPLIPNASGAKYVTAGYILFTRDEDLWGVKYDPVKRSISGAEFPLHPENERFTRWFYQNHSVADDGSLVFVPQHVEFEEQRELVWVTHEGVEEPLKLRRGSYTNPTVSPDGEKIAVTWNEAENTDIWIHEINRDQSLDRFTFDLKPDRGAVWEFDKPSIAFTSFRGDKVSIYRKPVEGGGEPTKVQENLRIQSSIAFNRDGSAMLYAELNNGWDLNLQLFDEGVSKNIVESQSGIPQAAFSPNGKWFVYSATEEDKQQLFLKSFPDSEKSKYQLTTQGGGQPRWSPEGDRLYYRLGSKMMAIDLDPDAPFRTNPHVEIFDKKYYHDEDFGSVQYDLEYPEGKRFVMVKEIIEKPTDKFVYITNWFQELLAAAEKSTQQ